MGDNSKIQDLIRKLKRLDCPVLASGEEAWVKEILFKPNFDRYHLMEWIFSKLGFNIPKEDECQNSSEVKMKNLLSAISALGLCGAEDADVIQGLAPLKEQLALWTTLIDILWKKCGSVSLRSEASTPNINDDASRMVSDEYKRQRRYIGKLCSQVNYKHLFREKLQLFPPYLLKECKESGASAIPGQTTVKEIKAAVLEKSQGELSFKNNILNGSLHSSVNKDSVRLENEPLNKLEEHISSLLFNLRQQSSGNFKNAYGDLKFSLNVPQDDSEDIGLTCQAAESKLDTFLNMKNSVSLLQAAETDLRKLNLDMVDFKVPNQPLSDTSLKDYIAILNAEKKPH